MSKRNITKTGTTALKWIAVVTALMNMPELAAVLGEKATYLGVAFAGISALKDTIITIIDLVDDGQLNQSFPVGKTVSLLGALFIGAACLGMTSCENFRVVGSLRDANTGAELQLDDAGRATLVLPPINYGK